MRKNTLRIALFVVFSYMLLYMGSFAYHLLTYPGEELLYIYRVPWLFEEALRTFIELLPTVHVTAILLAFAVRTRRAGRSDPLEDPSIALRKIVLLFMLFTLIFSILDIGVHPMLQRHRHNRLYLSRVGLDYLKRANQADEEGNLKTALQLYRDYLSIDPDNELVDDRADKIAGRLSSEAQQEQPPSRRAVAAHQQYRQVAPADLVEMARDNLDNGDPFTAHYQTQLALELAPGREDAQRLAARARKRIRQLEPSREERRKYDVYSRKVAGYNALDRDRPVEAYYIFEALRREVPNDSDVQEYFQLSRQEAQQVTYFIEGARQTDTIPGVRKVLYLSPEPDKDETSTPQIRRALYFDRLVRVQSGTWVHQPEIIEYTSGGNVRFHLTAPYGKIRGSSLILRGIHRSQREGGITPEYRTGSPPQGPAAHIFSLKPSVNQLQMLGQRGNSLERLTLPELIKLEPVFEEFGYPPEEVEVTILERLGEPFLVFIFSFLAASLGIRLRARRRRFPVLPLIAVPLVPPVVYVLLEAYRYTFLLSSSLFVTLTGMTATLLLFLGSQIVLLSIGMLSLAIYREP